MCKHQGKQRYLVHDVVIAVRYETFGERSEWDEMEVLFAMANIHRFG